MNYHLNRMASLLTINEEEKREIVAKLTPYWEDQIAIIWGIDDIIDRAKSDNKTISVTQAKDILIAMDRGHDANIGISWDTIDAHIQMTLTEA